MVYNTASTMPKARDIHVLLGDVNGGGLDPGLTNYGNPCKKCTMTASDELKAPPPRKIWRASYEAAAVRAATILHSTA
eukprot:3411764-Amphidinium_carterae.1